jgi:hypothetical protein
MEFFSDIPTPVWVALLGVISGIGARFVSESKINASFERARIKTIAESLTVESAFRAKLTAEIAIVRGLVKVCEADRDTRQPGRNRSTGRALALPASNENIAQPVLLAPDDNVPRTQASARTSRVE